MFKLKKRPVAWPVQRYFMANITYKTWIKITIWALVIHIVLIAISILEVFIYSLFKPNQEENFYTEHAQLTGPYISIIFGFIIFYFVAKYLSKKITRKKKIIIALFLPIIYTILDFIMVQYSGVNWNQHLLIFSISALAKLTGSFLGAFHSPRDT